MRQDYVTIRHGFWASARWMFNPFKQSKLRLQLCLCEVSSFLYFFFSKVKVNFYQLKSMSRSSLMFIFLLFATGKIRFDLSDLFKCFDCSRAVQPVCISCDCASENSHRASFFCWPRDSIGFMKCRTLLETVYG